MSVSPQVVVPVSLQTVVPIVCRPFGWLVSPPLGQRPTFHNVRKYCIENKNSLIKTSSPALFFGFSGLIIGVFGWLYSRLKETGSTQYLFGALGVAGAVFAFIGKYFGVGSLGYRGLHGRTSSQHSSDTKSSRDYIPITKSDFVSMLRDIYKGNSDKKKGDSEDEAETSMLRFIELPGKLKKFHPGTILPWLYELALGSNSDDRAISHYCLDTLADSLRREVLVTGLISYLTARYGPENVFSSLVDLLTTRDEIKTIRNYVADAFGLLKVRESVSYLARYMRDNPNDPEMLYSCIFAIVEISGVESLEAMLNENLPVGVKQVIEFSISRLSGTPYTLVTDTDLTVGELVDALKDRKMPTVQRLQVADLLLNYREGASGLADELFGAVVDHSADSLSRVISLYILIYRNDRSIVDLITGFLKTPKISIFNRTASGIVLGNKNDPYTIEALKSCLDGHVGDAYTRHIAEIALTNIADRRSTDTLADSSKLFGSVESKSTRIHPEQELSKFAARKEIERILNDCSDLKLDLGHGRSSQFVVKEGVY